jgi:hypothetical protein
MTKTDEKILKGKVRKVQEGIAELPDDASRCFTDGYTSLSKDDIKKAVLKKGEIIPSTPSQIKKAVFYELRHHWEKGTIPSNLLLVDTAIDLAIEKTRDVVYKQAKNEYEQLRDKGEKLINLELKEQVEQARQDEREKIQPKTPTFEALVEELRDDFARKFADKNYHLTNETTYAFIKHCISKTRAITCLGCGSEKEVRQQTLSEVREWLLKESISNRELPYTFFVEFDKKFGVGRHD